MGMTERTTRRSSAVMRVLAAASLSASALFGLSATPSASAQRCPDLEVLFARGTGEPPGVGPTGQAFVDSMRDRVGQQTMQVYPVDYPASDQWSTGVDGVRDASARALSTAEDCPSTKMVLGGYSQGAAVMGFVTSADVPGGIDPATVPKPLSPDVANHVVAVVLYGLPNVRAMNVLGQPPVVIGPSYPDKTLSVCVPRDPVCTDGFDFTAHDTYAQDTSVVDRGTDFAATRLGQTAGSDAVPRSPSAAFGR